MPNIRPVQSGQPRALVDVSATPGSPPEDEVTPLRARAMLDLLLKTQDQKAAALSGNQSEAGDVLVRDFSITRTGFVWTMRPIESTEMTDARELCSRYEWNKTLGVKERVKFEESNYRDRCIYLCTVRDGDGVRIWDLAAKARKQDVVPDTAWQQVLKALLVGERDQAFNELMRISGYPIDGDEHGFLEIKAKT